MIVRRCPRCRQPMPRRRWAEFLTPMAIIAAHLLIDRRARRTTP